MKCPHCYCNYDDAERECPMCGTRTGLVTCRNNKHKAITYPSPRQAERKPPAGQQVHQAGRAAPVRPAPVRPAMMSSRSEKEIEKALKKRRRRAAIWTITILVLLQCIPLLLDGIADIHRQLKFYDDSGFHFSDRQEESASDDLPAAPEPELEPEDTDDNPFLNVPYICDETGLSIHFNLPDLTYTLTKDDYTEEGDFYLQYNDPETISNFYSETFPAAAYDSYFVAFGHTDEGQDSEKYVYTAVIAYLPHEGRGFYLDNLYADALWLPLDRAVLLTPAAD